MDCFEVSNNVAIYFDSSGVEHVLKKIKSLLEIKTFKQIYLEYKQIIQWYVDIFALDLLILCLLEKLGWIY